MEIPTVSKSGMEDRSQLPAHLHLNYGTLQTQALAKGFYKASETEK